MKYFVAHGLSIDSLTDRVNSYLLEGWKLQGGVAVVNDKRGVFIFYQAMIRED